MRKQNMESKMDLARYVAVNARLWRVLTHGCISQSTSYQHSCSLEAMPSWRHSHALRGRFLPLSSFILRNLRAIAKRNGFVARILALSLVPFHRLWVCIGTSNLSTRFRLVIKGCNSFVFIALYKRILLVNCDRWIFVGRTFNLTRDQRYRYQALLRGYSS
jgi:hypothetical protein